MNYNKIEDIPREEDIAIMIKGLFPDMQEYTHSETAFGGNNMISIIKNNDNKKIVFRRTNSPINTIPFNFLIHENFKNYLKQHNLPENNTEVETFINKNYIVQESKIWNLAHYHNISPYLYYYGIYRKTEIKQPNPTSSIMKKMLPAESYHNIYKVVISEGYDMNISDYYNKQPNDGYTDKQSNKLSDTDKMIADQLIVLLDTLHSKIKVICFDIKPSNCVINLDPFDVKLIDLDADWCHDTPILKKRDTKYLIKFLSIMTLANHFLYYCNWNIFSDYLLDNKHNLDTYEPSLKILFCELNNNYKKITEHYLYYDELNRTDDSGYPRQKPNTCEELFDEMFQDMFKLQYKSNNTINTHISSKKRTVVSLDSKSSKSSKSSKRKKGGTKKKNIRKGKTKKKNIRKGGTKKKKNFRFKNDDIDSEMRGILEPNSILNFYKNTEPKSISMYNLLEEGTLDKSLKEKLTNKPVSTPKSILKKGGQNPDESGCTTDEENSVLNLNDISGIEPDPNDPNNSSLFSGYSFNFDDSLDNSTNGFNLNDSNNSDNVFNDSIDNTRLTDIEEY